MTNDCIINIASYIAITFYCVMHLDNLVFRYILICTCSSSLLLYSNWQDYICIAIAFEHAHAELVYFALVYI